MTGEKPASSFYLGSYYTKDTPYYEVAQQYYIPSAMKLMREYGVNWKLFAIDSLGSWTKNVAEKPRIIKEMLDSIPKDKNLFFVDSDATILEYPKLLNELNDFLFWHFHPQYTCSLYL